MFELISMDPVRDLMQALLLVKEFVLIAALVSFSAWSQLAPNGRGSSMRASVLPP